MLNSIKSWFYKYDKYKLDVRKFDIFVIVIICLLCIGFTGKVFQNDTFYTIPIGRDILRYGVDMLDHYSFHGLPYTYPHWLFDVIIYLIYLFDGFRAIYIFSICLYMVIGILLYFLTVNLYNNRFVSFVATVFAIIWVSCFITPRAQIVTYVLFILELFFIEKFLITSNKKYLISFPIISLLIVNMHCAVWIFFFLLFMPYICEYLFALFNLKDFNLFKFLFNKKIDVVYNKNVKYLIVIMFLCLLTGFITLNSFTPFTYLINTITGDTTSWIGEHKPPLVMHSPSLLFYLYVFIFMFIFIKNKIRLSDLFLSLGLFILAFVSFRHISLLIICFIYPLIRFFDSFLKSYNKRLSIIFVKFFTKNYIVFIVIFFIISFSNYYYNKIYKQEYVDISQYPVSAANYVIDNLDVNEIRLFNEYDYGSYLLFKGIPVFIDSRADLYTPQFNGLDRSITNDFLNIVGNYDEVFDYYNITHVMVYKCDKKINCSGLFDLLYFDNNYNLIYEDKYFAIFERDAIG